MVDDIPGSATRTTRTSEDGRLLTLAASSGARWSIWSAGSAGIEPADIHQAADSRRCFLELTGKSLRE
jgi:hypothetical protein